MYCLFKQIHSGMIKGNKREGLKENSTLEYIKYVYIYWNIFDVLSESGANSLVCVGLGLTLDLQTFHNMKLFK